MDLLVWFMYQRVAMVFWPNQPVAEGQRIIRGAGTGRYKDDFIQMQGILELMHDGWVLNEGAIMWYVHDTHEVHCYVGRCDHYGVPEGCNTLACIYLRALTCNIFDWTLYQAPLCMVPEQVQDARDLGTESPDALPHGWGFEVTRNGVRRSRFSHGQRYSPAPDA